MDNNIEEQLLSTNTTNFLSTSNVKKYLSNMARKTPYVLYAAGIGFLLYGGGIGFYEQVENEYGENEKIFNSDDYLKFLLAGFGTISTGKVLKMFIKCCDNSNNIESRLDQQLSYDSNESSASDISITPLPAYEQAISYPKPSSLMMKQQHMIH